MPRERKMFSLYVWADLLKKVEVQAEKSRVSKAQIVNQALAEFFASREKRK